MTTKKRFSRRCLLRSAVEAAGTAVVLGAAVTAADAARFSQPTYSKSAVDYQTVPLDNERCSNCKLFVPPNACRSVEGVISPRGWCDIYVAKA